MFKPVILYLLAVAASCSADGWKTENVYKYDHQICFSFIKNKTIVNGLTRCDLLIQPLSSDKFSVTIQNVRGRKVWDAKEADKCEAFPSDESDFKNEGYSGEPFEVSMKKGVVTGLSANSNVKDSELFLIKTVASMLQLDLQGEKCKDPKSCQLPTATKPDAVYETVENTTAGICETQYQVSPASEGFKVTKTTDYLKCLGSSTYSTSKSKVDNYVSYKNTNHVTGSGNVENYIIQSADLTLKGVRSQELVHFPGVTMVLFSKLTLTSTNPAEGPRSVSSPQEVNLTYHWLN